MYTYRGHKEGWGQAHSFQLPQSIPRPEVMQPPACAIHAGPVQSHTLLTTRSLHSLQVYDTNVHHSYYVHNAMSPKSCLSWSILLYRLIKQSLCDYLAPLAEAEQRLSKVYSDPAATLCPISILPQYAHNVRLHSFLRCAHAYVTSASQSQTFHVDTAPSRDRR